MARSSALPVSGGLEFCCGALTRQVRKLERGVLPNDSVSAELMKMLESFRQRIARTQGEGGLRDSPGSPGHQNWHVERPRQAIEGIYAPRR